MQIPHPGPNEPAPDHDRGIAVAVYAVAVLFALAVLFAPEELRWGVAACILGGAVAMDRWSRARATDWIAALRAHHREEGRRQAWREVMDACRRLGVPGPHPPAGDAAPGSAPPENEAGPR